MNDSSNKAMIDAFACLEFNANEVAKSLAALSEAFKASDLLMREWSALYKQFARCYPWYNRLRWALDAYVPRSWSSLRSVRRFRVYVERGVRELEGDA
jgi:hypothetical protein